MEIAKAKEFWLITYPDDLWGENKGKVYISKNIDTLIELNGGKDGFDTIALYGLIETSSGENLIEVERAYNDELILTKRFMHVDSFKSLNSKLTYEKV